MMSCIENLENEKEVMENLQKIHKALIEGANIEDIFKFPTEEFENRKKTNNSDDLIASIEEIEKMDAMLKIKVAEERQAKLSRMQMEEESKDILAKLPCYENSNRIKVNLEEFLRLLSDAEKSDGDSLTLVKLHEANDSKKNKEEEEERKEKTTPQQRLATDFKFVERNIQLAKCGRGTLSLTDEEKLRIEFLLENIESPVKTSSKESEISKNDSENNENENYEVYAIDPETKSALNRIDQRLQELTKSKIRKKPLKKPDSIEKKEAEEEEETEKEKEKVDEKEKKVKGREKEKKNTGRLEEINKLLNSMNSASEEEINPLSEKDIENLIEESKESLHEEKILGTEREGADCTPPQEVITELISNAKLLMPKFKYRFDGS